MSTIKESKEKYVNLDFFKEFDTNTFQGMMGNLISRILYADLNKIYNFQYKTTDIDRDAACTLTFILLDDLVKTILKWNEKYKNSKDLTLDEIKIKDLMRATKLMDFFEEKTQKKFKAEKVYETCFEALKEQGKNK